MGKGIIVSHNGDGLYAVEVQTERKRITAQIETLEKRIGKLDGIISLEEAELAYFVDAWAKEPLKTEWQWSVRMTQHYLHLHKTERLAAVKQVEYLSRIPAKYPVTAWCADLTTDLAGTVALIEVPGELPVVQVRPGYDGRADYTAERDGILKPALEYHPCDSFINWAIYPGWQKWRPTYRHGVITSIDGDKCDVALDTAESSQQGLDVNQTATLTGIDIEYMDCNGAAFEAGDAVVVEFVGQRWQNARVIGFKDHPQDCGGYFIRLFFDGLPEPERAVKIGEEHYTTNKDGYAGPFTIPSPAYPQIVNGPQFEMDVYDCPERVYEKDGREHPCYIVRYWSSYLYLWLEVEPGYDDWFQNMASCVVNLLTGEIVDVQGTRYHKSTRIDRHVPTNDLLDAAFFPTVDEISRVDGDGKPINDPYRVVGESYYWGEPFKAYGRTFDASFNYQADGQDKCGADCQILSYSYTINTRNECTGNPFSGYPWPGHSLMSEDGKRFCFISSSVHTVGQREDCCNCEPYHHDMLCNCTVSFHDMEEVSDTYKYKIQTHAGELGEIDQDHYHIEDARKDYVKSDDYTPCQIEEERISYETRAEKWGWTGLAYMSSRHWDVSTIGLITDQRSVGITAGTFTLTGEAATGWVLATYLPNGHNVVRMETTGKINIGSHLVHLWLTVKPEMEAFIRDEDRVFMLRDTVCALGSRIFDPQRDCDLSDFFQAILDLINIERGAGRPVLAPNYNLMIAAGRHASDIGTADYAEIHQPLTMAIAHTGTDGSSPSERIWDSGYHDVQPDTAWSGENIAVVFPDTTPEEIVAAWMDSPSHQANILEAGYQEVGFSEKISATGRKYLVNTFGGNW